GARAPGPRARGGGRALRGRPDAAARAGRRGLPGRPAGDRRTAAGGRRRADGPGRVAAGPRAAAGAARRPARRRPPLPALRAVTLRLRDRTLTPVPGRPLLMGIVNANPDSFADAVRLDTVEKQLAHARRLVGEG